MIVPFLILLMEADSHRKLAFKVAVVVMDAVSETNDGLNVKSRLFCILVVFFGHKTALILAEVLFRHTLAMKSTCSLANM